MGKWSSKAGITLLAVGMLVVAASASATPSSVRKQIESSLLVTGTVDIEPDGSVSVLAIDKEDKLPESVVTFVRESGMQWRFEPVVRDGKAVRARSPMSVRVVAKKLEGNEYRITLAGASFDRYDAEDPEQVSAIKTTPPTYPEKAWRVGAAGSAYLVVKVGLDGKVQEAVVEQVNLRVAGTEMEMRMLRGVFAKNALAAAKDWTFRPPTQGKRAQAPFWSVRVPVSFTLQGLPTEDSYGKWISYIPGPRQVAPWAQDEEGAGFSPDTLADGGVYMANGRSPRLLTPLQGG
ncbi:MAG TPA: protein tonB [Stenotrophomonas sp.]|jgi:hypothetical protein